MYNLIIKNHNIKLLILTFALQIPLSTASYAQTEITHGPSPFNRAIIFGDSLSDNGHFSDFQTGFQGHTTTNGRFSNGAVWNEYLFANQQRGFNRGSILPNWSKRGDFGDQTGNRNVNVNYSVGGATYLATGSNYIPSITQQVDTFLQSGSGSANTISPDSLVSLWASANDALAALTDQTPLEEKTAAVKAKLLAELERLYQAGGRQFLLPDLPDFAQVPRFINSGSPLPHATTEAFNKTIRETITEFQNKHPDTTIYSPEMGGLLDTVIRYPELFGFKNTKDACIKIKECKDATRGSDLQNSYIFWDEIHPTTRTHHYIANYMSEYWLNPDLAGFYVTSPEGLFETERNYFFPKTDKIVSGYLTGNKALYKLEHGKLTLTGDHSYTGGTFVKDGELELGNGGTTGSVPGDVELDEKTLLSFNRSNFYDFGGKITGQGGVMQKGSGLTVLSGDSTYSGDTQITAGELMVNGSITSKAQVYSGAILSGIGTIGGLTAEQGSLVAPGDFTTGSLGTLKVNDDIFLKDGSTLHIAVGKDGATSGLQSSGAAHLGGRVVFGRNVRGVPLTVDETIAMLGKSSTFLQAEGGINGRFDKVEPQYRFIGAELDYRQKDVAVTFAETNKRFSDDAITKNQKTVADAVQALGLHNKLHDSFLASTYDDNLPPLSPN